MDLSLFENKITCICGAAVVFEIINEIECDWGTHTVVQCPKCEELFSTDKQCPAFQTIIELAKFNRKLFSEKQKSDYLINSHPC